MTDYRIATDCSLCETSLDHARQQLGARAMADLWVVCGESEALAGRRLQGEHGFRLDVVPDAILLTRHAWCARFGNDTVWTAPSWQ